MNQIKLKNNAIIFFHIKNNIPNADGSYMSKFVSVEASFVKNKLKNRFKEEDMKIAINEQLFC